MKRTAILMLATALALAGCDKKGGDAAASGAPVAMTPGNAITSAADATVGMTIDGEIKKNGDAPAQSNFYKFTYTGKLRDVVKVRLENKSTTLRPEIKIYNSERSAKFDKYDGTPGANVEQDLSMNPGDVIYVEVLPYESVGAYRLSVLAQKAYDANEANDDVLKPTPVNFGNPIEGSVMDNQDNDWFHFTANSSGKVTVAVENQSSTLRPDVKVFNANKSAIMEKYDGTPGAGLDFTVDVPAGQDFYVQIVPYESTGKYRLTARGAVMASDMASALKTAAHIDLYGVYFDTDQSFVKPESANTLTEVANLLKADPTLRLEIAGHTDNAGSKEHNAQLSQGRADAVVAALVGQYGIDPGRLVAKGYGDSKPVAPNDNPAGMAKNRRVELRRL
jgi:outer membrane protein OmpA-like peptidoglycan-associated protein